MAAWKLSVLDPWKVHTIHAQKGHGYVLLLGSVMFHQAGYTPYSYAIIFKIIYLKHKTWSQPNLANLWSFANVSLHTVTM